MTVAAERERDGDQVVKAFIDRIGGRLRLSEGENYWIAQIYDQDGHGVCGAIGPTQEAALTALSRRPELEPAGPTPPGGDAG